MLLHDTHTQFSRIIHLRQARSRTFCVHLFIHEIHEFMTAIKNRHYSACAVYRDSPSKIGLICCSHVRAVRCTSTQFAAYTRTHSAHAHSRSIMFLSLMQFTSSERPVLKFMYAQIIIINPLNERMDRQTRQRRERTSSQMNMYAKCTKEEHRNKKQRLHCLNASSTSK